MPDDIHNTFNVKIEAGVLKFAQSEIARLTKYRKSRSNGNYEIVLRKKRNKEPRSGQQNKYYWGVVLKLICEVTGYTDKELHEIMLIKFSSEPDNEYDFTITHRSSEMTKPEFHDYVEKIRDWASAELGVYIPDPE